MSRVTGAAQTSETGQQPAANITIEARRIPSGSNDVLLATGGR
jgi:hypothetical protein